MKNKFTRFSGLIIVFLAAAAYLFLIWQFSKTLSDQALYRKQLVAKAGGETISVFVQSLGFQTATFATRASIVTPNSVDTPSALKALIEGWKGTPVYGVVLTDANGVVMYGVERPGPIGPGSSIADRDCFKWAKSAGKGEIYLGDPIITRMGFSKGQYIVPITTPVIKNGEFNGAVVTAFSLDDLRNDYLESLKIRDSSRIYLIDKNGAILSSTAQELIGTNYLDYVKKSGIAGKDEIIKVLGSALNAKSEGEIDLTLPDETKNGEPVHFLIGYAPINIYTAHWVLAVAAPADEATSSLNPFYLTNLGLAGLVILASLVIAIYLAKTVDGAKEVGKKTVSPMAKREE
jgi:hypothetical protein